jgi:molybdopterin-binding protein
MSYPALKHWILAGRLRTVKTPGGHHRVPVEALDELMQVNSNRASVPPRIIGQNQLLGVVVEVTIEGLLAKVDLTVGGQRVTAIITADAAHELSLTPGDSALVLIKATEVMIAKS